MKQRAMAIVIATTLIATGLTLSAGAAQQPTDCVPTFLIADSELLATPRILLGNSEEIGMEEVIAGNSETLNIRLETADDELEWKVFTLDDDEECVRYKSGTCDGVLDSSGESDSCVLDAPASGVASYFVKFENPESDPLTYVTFVS